MLDFSLQDRVGLNANGVATAFFVRPVYRRAIERTTFSVPRAAQSTTFSLVMSGLDKPGAKRLLRLTQHQLGPPSDVVHREIRSKLFEFLGGGRYIIDRKARWRSWAKTIWEISGKKSVRKD